MTVPHYNFHVFVCQNQRASDSTRGCCMSKGAAEIIDYIKTTTKKLGIKNIRINKAGCLNECERGVAVVIYPEGTWYSIKSITDAEQIVSLHLAKGKQVEDLLMN